MVKAAGGVFLGEPRTKESAEAREVTKSMRVSMYFLFVLSLVMVILAPCIVRFTGGETAAGLAKLTAKLSVFSVICTVFLFVMLLLQNLFCKGGKRVSPTWDCGYARPDARMEYTATAFTQPLADFFAPVLKRAKKIRKPEKIFAEEASYEEKNDDAGLEYIWKKLAQVGSFLAGKIHFLQSGNLHGYIFMVLLVLGGMLVYAMLKK